MDDKDFMEGSSINAFENTCLRQFDIFKCQYDSIKNTFPFFFSCLPQSPNLGSVLVHSSRQDTRMTFPQPSYIKHKDNDRLLSPYLILTLSGTQNWSNLSMYALQRKSSIKIRDNKRG